MSIYYKIDCRDSYKHPQNSDFIVPRTHSFIRMCHIRICNYINHSLAHAERWGLCVKTPSKWDLLGGIAALGRWGLLRRFEKWLKAPCPRHFSGVYASKHHFSVCPKFPSRSHITSIFFFNLFHTSFCHFFYFFALNSEITWGTWDFPIFAPLRHFFLLGVTWGAWDKIAYSRIFRKSREKMM